MGQIGNVAIIGGDPKTGFGTFGDHLREHGIGVGHHQDRDAHNISIPQSVEAVLVIRDCVGHVAYHQAKDQAKDLGIPLITCSYKWSVAEPVLRAQGILPEVTVKVTGVSARDRNEVVKEYITTHREQGRMPKIDEVIGALTRVYGPGVTLPPKVFKRLSGQVSAQVVLPEKPKDGPKMVKYAPQDLPKLIKHAVQDEVLDNPEIVTTPNVLIGLICDFLRSEDVEVLEGVGKLITKEIVRIKKGWASAKTTGQVEERDLLIRQYLFEKWEAFHRGDGEYPSVHLMRDKVRNIFGIPMNSRLLKMSRGDSYGAWAVELETLSRLKGYFQQVFPDLDQTLSDLVKEGKIKSIRTAKVYLSSKVAIDEYAASLVPTSETLSEEPVSEHQIDVEGLMLEVGSLVAEKVEKMLGPLTETLGQLQSGLGKVTSGMATSQEYEEGGDVITLLDHIQGISWAVNDMADNLMDFKDNMERGEKLNTPVPTPSTPLTPQTVPMEDLLAELTHRLRPLGMRVNIEDIKV